MNPSEIAERAARLINSNFVGKLHMENCAGCERVIAEMKRIIERAIEESRGQRWIPVEEKLPTLAHGGVGLCPCRFYVESTERQFSGYFDPLYKNWIIATEDSHTQHQVDEVTHWQPLPDPPKGNENG